MNERLVRRVFYPLHERLKRKPTFQRLAELERSQWLSPELLGEYQFSRLRSLVEFAYAHVPYYRAILDDHGLTPQRLQSPRERENCGRHSERDDVCERVELDAEVA